MMRYGQNYKVRSKGGTGMNFCRWGTKKYPKLNRDKKVSYKLKLYEVIFNNDSRNFDRDTAVSKIEVIKKFKKRYPKDKVTSVILLSDSYWGQS